ncbi:protein ORF36 [Cyprinid herpesvirus 1]|uniref:Protein ORF36 n=1 Tax=Cyprinid herpesvirus 1 TaxID=317858 RepID=K7PCK0_9VIRU|nr:protein ORF36 [Cyprinid herpesvirus 1]AFJ20340.1 protein ORF36 [Cyprinid herpesvirus 1]
MMPECVFEKGALFHEYLHACPVQDTQKWMTGKMLLCIGLYVVGESDPDRQYKILERLERVRDLDTELEHVYHLVQEQDYPDMLNYGHVHYHLWGLGLAALGYRLIRALCNKDGAAEFYTLKKSISSTLATRTFYQTLPVFHYI